MKFEQTEVWGFEHAMRGMRNPMNSWDKGDTKDCDDVYDGDCPIYCPLYKNCSTMLTHSILMPIIGKNDMNLAQRLISAGTEHRKFLRQIMISVDITAPLYWYKEFDTYKIGTTANSTSTMHKLTSSPINMDCFEMDDYESVDIERYEWDKFTSDEYWVSTIHHMETLRQKYVSTKEKKYWKELIRILPSSWLQKRTITLNYENIYSMIRHRDHHKLCEWSEAFIDWCKSLPYAEELLFFGLEKELKESDEFEFKIPKERTQLCVKGMNGFSQILDIPEGVEVVTFTTQKREENSLYEIGKTFTKTENENINILKF